MEFLDPKRERITRIILFVSYGLIGLAIGIASLILLYQTDGYCVDGSGTVDRCGLIFLSSQPNGATVTINGKAKKELTNSKFNVRSGSYNFRLDLAGYRAWQRSVTVQGGDVQRFDYALLFPQKLTTTDVASFAGPIQAASQSPNHRWLVLIEAGQSNQMKLYDFKTPAKPVLSSLSLPASTVTASETTPTWKIFEWSTNNRHFLVERDFTNGGAAGHEYLVIDSQNPAGTRNITRELSLAAGDQITLFNKKPTLFYVYNTEAKTLRTAAVNGNSPTTLQLQHVIAYKTYADDTLLYVTDTPPSGKPTVGMVSVVLQQGTRTIVLRRLPASASAYLLDIAKYDGDWYVVLAGNNQRGAYVYVNPFDQKLTRSTDTPLPLRFMKVANPQYVAFSASAQFIMAENGQQFAVYDAEYDASYGFVSPYSLDSPQQHVQWMDGNHLVFVSGGLVRVLDYDNQNPQTLQPAMPDHQLFFSPNYKYIFSVGQASAPATRLTSTPLALPTQL